MSEAKTQAEDIKKYKVMGMVSEHKDLLLFENYIEMQEDKDVVIDVESAM